MSANISGETSGHTSFKPSPKLVRIYWLYSLAYFIPAAVCYGIITYFNVLIGIILYVTLIAAPAAFLAYWIPRFYGSIRFSLENDHAYASFGVWWVKKKRVPYNLVSEVRVRQGPLQRSLGLACVDVYTPAMGVTKPELTFFQVSSEEAERVAEDLRLRVGILSSKERRVLEKEMLNELRAIRKILESITSSTKQ